MQFFFTGSVRAGRANQPQFEYILKELGLYGDIFSSHVASSLLPQYGETSLSGREIIDREKECIQKSDYVVAEVTTPSLGVGYLIHYASSLGKKIIVLYNDKNTLKLSAIIKGDEHTSLYLYQKQEDIKVIFSEIF